MKKVLDMAKKAVRKLHNSVEDRYPLHWQFQHGQISDNNLM